MNTLPNRPGLYMLTSPSGGRYIGMTTVNMRKRFWRHVTSANAGEITRIAMAIRKYGKENITTEVLVECADKTTLRIMEKKAIGVYGTTEGRNYNIREQWNYAPDTTGYKHTAEAKRKIAAFQQGQVRSAETRAKMSAGTPRTAVIVHGKKYLSINAAARHFGINPGTAFYRLNADHHEEWHRGT